MGKIRHLIVHLSFLFMIATHKRKRLKSMVYIMCSQKKHNDYT